jgi:hypothetical protein
MILAYCPPKKVRKMDGLYWSASGAELPDFNEFFAPGPSRRSTSADALGRQR